RRHPTGRWCRTEVAMMAAPIIAENAFTILRSGQQVYWVRQPRPGQDVNPSREPLPAVVIGVGRPGICLRVAEPWWGSSWRLRRRWVHPDQLRPRTQFFWAVDLTC